MNDRKSTEQLLVGEDHRRLTLTNCSENCDERNFKKAFAVCLAQHFPVNFLWSHN
jgi:hypothetical protein